MKFPYGYLFLGWPVHPLQNKVSHSTIMIKACCILACDLCEGILIIHNYTGKELEVSVYVLSVCNAIY